jgi:hypothetical protein
MNIINRFFLWVVLLPSKVYEQMGINVHQLRAVIKTKLLIDDRRPNTIHQTQQKKQKKPISFATLGSMFMSAFLGSFFLISFFVGHDMITRLTIYFSFFIFVLASTLIADFTSVLIDIRDNVVILPKPISDKTFVLARLLHIVIHISKMVIPMVLPALIVLIYRYGILKLIPFLILTGLATLFTIFLINALYIFILRITTPERFKAIISYFQIFFAITCYAGYQLVPRLINKAAMEQYDIRTNVWVWLAPPYWFAGGWELLTSFEFSLPLFICLLLSIMVPLLSIWIVIKYFAPSFNQKLSMISGSGSETGTSIQETKNEKNVPSRISYSSQISEWFTEKGAERMSFKHVWKMSSRSRDFKMKVYPSLGYLVVYLVIMFMNNNKISLADIQDQSGRGKIIFIGLIYFSSLMLIMSLNQMMFSDKYKAAWFYYTTPIETPGKIISGAVKAMIAKFYLPLITITSIVALVIVGPKIIPNLLFGLFNQFLITCTIAFITIRELPFSQAQNQAKSNFIRGLFSMLIPGSIAILHYMIYSFMPVVIILCLLSGIASWLVMDAIKNKKWADLKLSYQD